MNKNKRRNDVLNNNNDENKVYNFDPPVRERYVRLIATRSSRSYSLSESWESGSSELQSDFYIMNAESFDINDGCKKVKNGTDGEYKEYNPTIILNHLSERSCLYVPETLLYYSGYETEIVIGQSSDSTIIVSALNVLLMGNSFSRYYKISVELDNTNLSFSVVSAFNVLFHREFNRSYKICIKLNTIYFLDTDQYRALEKLIEIINKVKDDYIEIELYNSCHCMTRDLILKQFHSKVVFAGNSRSYSRVYWNIENPAPPTVYTDCPFRVLSLEESWFSERNKVIKLHPETLVFVLDSSVASQYYVKKMLKNIHPENNIRKVHFNSYNWEYRNDDVYDMLCTEEGKLRFPHLHYFPIGTDLTTDMNKNRFRMEIYDIHRSFRGSIIKASTKSLRMDRYLAFELSNIILYLAGFMGFNRDRHHLIKLIDKYNHFKKRNNE
jgi:hypothetical protein